jgi:2-polyprenyl-3-methyl-5-hydroxy-6-metoxy-1,4-benzoquinol methylase
MAARLARAGFADVHTVARDPLLCGDLREPEQRPPEHPEAVTLDLRSEFASQFDRRFAVVTSSELIEHLPSPRAFLVEVARLLEPGGSLVITTPNVSNWIGRLRFLWFGELRWFDDYWGRKLNHISPITTAQMRMMLAECGFELIASDSAGSFTGPVAAAFAAPFILPFLALSGSRAWGDCNVFVARRGTSPGH